MTSVMVLSLGLVTLLFPQSLDNPSLEFFREDANIWAGLFISVGVLRVLSLIVNGHWAGSSVFRLLGSWVGAAVFSAVAFNLLRTTGFTYITWGASTYLWIVFFEFVNSYFITKDVANYIKYRGNILCYNGYLV